MWNKFADTAIILSSICCSLTAAILASAFLFYRAGASNAAGTSPFFLTLLFMAAGFCFGLCAFILGILRFRKWRWSYRVLWFLLLTLPMPCALAGNYSAGGRNAAEQYEAGFNRWAQRNIDTPAIRAWLSMRAPAAPVPPNVVTAVPPADWPPKIVPLHPTDFSESPEGIFLTWGQFGTWGDQRQIFIGRAPSTPDPPVIFWGREWQPIQPGSFSWTQIAPGVYAWVQSGG